ADVAVPIITAVASALDYAHKMGLLHRDVKPANTIVADLDTDQRRVFLADFGIARPLDDTSGITTTNMTVGTVAYAAPEQLMGEQMTIVQILQASTTRFGWHWPRTLTTDIHLVPPSRTPSRTRVPPLHLCGPQLRHPSSLSVLRQVRLRSVLR